MSAEYGAQLTKADRPEQLDRQPVGTGPFQLEEYRAGQYVRLQRHPDYWRGKPLMPQVVVDLGSGGTGRLSKLLTGECDVLARPAASQLTILRDDPRLRLTLRPGMNIARWRSIPPGRRWINRKFAMRWRWLSTTNA